MHKSGFKKRYLEKFTRYPKQTSSKPREDTYLIIVIPCLNEPGILTTLQSLWQCKRPEKPVEVLITINHSSEAPEEVKAYNEQTFREVQKWAKDHQDEKLVFIPLWYPYIKPKIAGVGTARKLGMDEAVYRFYDTGNAKGIIACLDADCTVAGNYLTALEAHFRDNPDTSGCTIYFEHPLSGSFPPKIYEAILDFELYLRYYKNAFLWCGFPYAYHTIGSVMAVPCDVYQKVGGMNKQKAGEDFYFLQKVIFQGNFTELNDTCVYPSPRKSLRVPFGTGQAVTDFIENEESTLMVFNPAAYQDFKAFIDQIPKIFDNQNHPSKIIEHIPESIRSFLAGYDFNYYMRESLANAGDKPTFINRFFHWFNAFMALKYLHFARDHFYANVPVKEAVEWLIDKLELPREGEDKIALLKVLRQFDRNSAGIDWKNTFQ